MPAAPAVQLPGLLPGQPGGLGNVTKGTTSAYSPIALSADSARVLVAWSRLEVSCRLIFWVR